MKTLQEVKLSDIMPSSLLSDSNVQAMCAALDPELKLVTGSAGEALILERIDELDERVIDLLAYEYHVDFYDLADTIEKKRSMVRESLKWHMKKGTRYAILKALDMLGIEASYENWYEFGGEPYTFRINATVKPEYYEHSDNHELLMQKIYRAVNDSKAARSLMVQLNTKINEDDSFKLYHGIAQGLSGYYHVYVDAPILPDINITHGIGECLSGRRIMWPSEPEQEFIMSIYEGVVMTLISRFDVKVDYLQPETEYQDKIYIACPSNIGGSQRVNYAFDEPVLSQSNEIGLIQTESYAVKIASAPYNYGQKCRDIWNLTGYPEREMTGRINMHSGMILTGHVKIDSEIIGE